MTTQSLDSKPTMTSQCDHCGRTFGHESPTAKYCGQPCKQAAYRNRKWCQDEDRRTFWSWADAKGALERAASWEDGARKRLLEVLSKPIDGTGWTHAHVIEALKNEGVDAVQAHDYVLSHRGRQAIRKHYVSKENGKGDWRGLAELVKASSPMRRPQ